MSGSQLDSMKAQEDKIIAASDKSASAGGGTRIMKLASTGISFFIILSITAVVSAGLIETDDLIRDFEPVIIKGSKIPMLIGTPIDEIAVFAYDGSSFSIIPFQVDEVSKENDPGLGRDYYFFEPGDGNLDANDEIAFMSMDMGDRCEISDWIGGAGSLRYEVSASDGCDNALRAWAYISTGSFTLSPVDYVDFTGTYPFDIETDAFTMSFVQNPNPLPATREIISFTDGDGRDLIDRDKIRVKVKILGIPVWSSEEDFEVTGDYYLRELVDGPIRVTEHVQSKFLDFYPQTSTVHYYNSYSTNRMNLNTDLGFLFPMYELVYKFDHNKYIDDINVCTDWGGGYSFFADGQMTGDELTFNETPYGTWFEAYSPTVGSKVELIDLWNVVQLGQPVESIKLFYQDGGVDPTGLETGQPGIWGEIGVDIDEPIKEESTLQIKTYLDGPRDFSMGEDFKLLYADSLQFCAAPQQNGANYMVTATPDEETYDFPKAGGTIRLYAEVSNLTASPQTFKAWVNATLPDGMIYGPIYGPLTVTLPPSFVAGANLSFILPRPAPAGDYCLNVLVGPDTNNPVCGDSFPFSKYRE